MRTKNQKNVISMALSILALVVLIGFIASCSPTGGENPEPAPNEGEQEYDVEIIAKKWAYLLYDDAEFIGFDPLMDFKDRAYSNQYLNVFVLQDDENGLPKMFYVDENHKLHLLKEMEEINMGAEETLRDFLDYVRAKSSPERVILSLYDHGGGWLGACWDESSGNDNLSMDEMQGALMDTGGVDIVCFSAPCLMGALESAYELRDCAEVYIGSEESSGFTWWRPIVDDICDTIKNDPDISNPALGEQIIQAIYSNSEFNYYSRVKLTMSAILTSKTVEVINAVEDLSIEFTNRMDESYALVNSVYPDVLDFGEGYSVDAYDLFEKCHAAANDAAFRGKLERAMAALSESVIAECHGSKMGNAHGLSINLPDTNKYYYHKDYGDPEYGLDFSRDTHWDEFVRAYFSMSGSRAPGQMKENSGPKKSCKPYIIDTDGFYPGARSKNR